MDVKSSFDKIIGALLSMAIASLIIRKGDFMATFFPKPFEVIMVIVLIVFITGIILKKIDLKELTVLFPRKVFVAISVLVLSTLIGWSITILGKGIPLNSDMIFDFGRLVLALFIFIFVLLYTRKYPDLFRYFFFALLSPVLYIVFIFLPKISTDYGLALDDGRFYGFMNNPSTVSKLILISLLFSFGLYLFEKKYKLKTVFFIMTIGLMSLVFWSGTRAAILATSIGFILIIFLYLKYNFSKKNIFTSFISILLVLFLGFLITPNFSKKIIIDRVLTQNTDTLPALELKEMKVIDVFKRSIKSKPTGMPETRITIWYYFAKQIMRNPLGMGPAYYTHTFTRVGPNNDLAGAHNSFMEIMLYGGWPAIISCLFLLIFTMKKLVVSIKNTTQKTIPVVLLSTLVALSIALLFDDHFKLYWFWVLLALSIAYTHIDTKINTTR